MKLRPRQRRKEAEERQAVSDLLSPEERLAKLDVGGWTAVRERAKLANEIATRDKDSGSEKPNRKKQKTKKKKRGA